MKNSFLHLNKVTRIINGKKTTFFIGKNQVVRSAYLVGPKKKRKEMFDEWVSFLLAGFFFFFEEFLGRILNGALHSSKLRFSIYQTWNMVKKVQSTFTYLFCVFFLFHLISNGNFNNRVVTLGLLARHKTAFTS